MRGRQHPGARKCHGTPRIALCEGTLFRAEDLPDNILYYQKNHDMKGPRELRTVVEESERLHIERVLQETSGNKKLAARILGIDLSSLYRKMEKLGMPAK